jgi:uncharacterized protein YndB with AHSA1/START domain
VPTASRTRRIPAQQSLVWDVLADPRRRMQWWPGVTRVEGVTEAQWTDVFTTRRGKPVRVDYRLVQADPPWRLLWEQELAGTPFERVLAESLTEVVLEPDGEETVVTIAQRQKLKGYSRTGGLLMRRGGRSQVDRALAGLAELFSG